MGPFLDGWTTADVDTVIARDDPDEVLFAPIVVSLDPPDCEWAESVCARLAVHSDERVRANAMLGFGHLARTCGRLKTAVVLPLLVAGKTDPSPLVRGHAESAADDIETYLGWPVTG